MLVLSDVPVPGDPAPGSLEVGALGISFGTRRMHVGVPTGVASSGILLVGDLNQIDAALADRPTSAQLTTALSGYSPVGHHHEISDVNGLSAALAAVQSTLPTGVICLWSGAANTVPAGWAICNGQNGTPNLTDRFIVGAGNNYAPGATGGNFGGTVTTSASGNHNHGGATAAHQLTWGQMPSHNHGVNDPGHSHHVNDPGHVHGVEVPGGGGLLAPGAINTRYGVQGGGTGVGWTGIWLNGSGTGITIAAAGGNEAHAHGISASGDHTHTVEVNSIPPYYALAYIMKLAPFTP